MFKNAQIYRLDPDWGVTRDELEAQLAKRTFQPCGSQDMESHGWVSPKGEDELVAAAGDHWMVALMSETKLLPSAVVNDLADERAAEIADQQGYKLGRKQLKELREQITQELLPRAFSRKRVLHAWIDPKGGWLVVNAPSQSKAEDLLEALRHTLDSFPLSLLRTELSPTSAMAEWLASGEAPEGFTLDQDFSLKSVAEDGAVATFKRHDLEGAHVKEHLEAGKLPTRLALTYNDRVSFVLTEKGELKSIDFLDVVRESLEDAEDASALFDAQLALTAGELGELIESLVAALGGELQNAATGVDVDVPEKMAFNQCALVRPGERASA